MSKHLHPLSPVEHPPQVLAGAERSSYEKNGRDALQRWETEGGATAPGDQSQSDSRPQPSVSAIAMRRHRL